MTAPADATHCIKTQFHIAYYKRDLSYPDCWLVHTTLSMNADPDLRWFPVRLTAQQAGKLEKLPC